MKNILVQIILIVLSILVSNNILSQNIYFYAQINDNSLIPTKKSTTSVRSITFKSKNSKMNTMLLKYKPKVFKQAFPTAKTPLLRKVFYIECDDKRFEEELKSEFGNKIPLVEDLCKPELLSYTPNDYNPCQTNLDLIKTKDAYNYYKNLPKVPVALTDTYFETHEDLLYLDIWGNNSYVGSSHGTHVAGLIGAITDNNTGIASVGYDTKLVGSSNWGSDNEVLLLAQAGYRVINCSWKNACSYSSIQNLLYQEIKNDWNAVVVFAAGNKSCGGGGEYCYPASYPANISVTSVTHGNNPDWHEQTPGDPNSAYQHNDAVDICAPGYNLYTTDLMGSAGTSSGNYSSGWGTSYSAPQVAGVVGVIFTINPCLTADEAVNILLNSTDNSLYGKPENAPYIGLLGKGRLDIEAAVKAAVESATLYLENQTISNNQNYNANYAIKINNVTIQNNANIILKTRKEVDINSAFEVKLGSSLMVDVDINNTIDCQ
ncbi:MAG: hypothetical protein DRJ01_09365 [Bacteroidetes bacterium]|nr:MAG: hypothetical protein DRJ01_09365 [Bacteroidota bacterium]